MSALQRGSSFCLSVVVPIAALLMAVLSGCGGGGGDGDGDTPPVTNVAPTASFTATPTTGVSPLTVNFDASASSDSDGTITTYTWNYGDGATATGGTVSHTYATAGTFSARLTVTDDDGATATVVREISVTNLPPPVNQPPVASFTASPLTGMAPLTVSFDASASSDADGTVVTYAWTFGDGATGTGVAAAHTYATAGTYTVRLLVTDDDAATANTTGDVTVTSTPPPANQPPLASFTASPASGDAPLTVAFDASASSDSDGVVAAYSWNFGDGATASGRTASHTYAAAGAYTAQLTVTDDDGAVASTTRGITVTTAPVNQLPVASFTASPSSGVAPLTVSFDAAASSDPDGSIATYAWVFGDGATATGRSTSHIYTIAGSYSPRLTVTDDDGATASVTRVISVLTSSGQWLGRYQSSLIADAPMYAEIVVTSTAVSGTYKDDAGRTGTLTGVISGSMVTLTIAETTPSCTGTFTGTGTLGSVAGLESIDFTFTGSDCLGAHAAGTGLLVRQTGYVLAWGQNEPTSLKHQGGELFWTDQSDKPLKKLNVVSGVSNSLTSRMRALTQLTVEPARLLWIDAIGDSNSYCTGIGVQQALMVAAIDGTGVRKLAEGPACGGTVAPVSDGTYVYWVTSRTSTNAWRIERVPLAGGAAEIMRTADGFASITALAVDNQHLYWIEDNAPDAGYVRRCSFDVCGYLMQTPFTGFSIDMATNLALTSEYIVFGARRYATPSDRIIRVPKTGSAGTDLATAPAFPTAVVTDGTTVFWTDANALHSVPVAGGAMSTLVTDRPMSGGLSVDSTRVAWTERPGSTAFSGSVRAVLKGGGPVETLVSNAASPRAVAQISNGDVIYADGVIDFLPASVSGIHRRSLSGSITTLVSGLSGAGPIAVDAANVYVADGWWIKRVPRGGGAASIVAHANFYITALDIDGSYVYWVEDDLGTVRKAPLTGGVSTTLGSGSGKPFDLRVEGSHVYFLLGLDKLLRVPVTGGAVETVASGLRASEALEADATFAYVTEGDIGRISRVPLAGGVAAPIGDVAVGMVWYALAGDIDRIYWLTPSAVGRAAKDGSSSTTISGAPLSDMDVHGSVAVDDSYVYWAETLIGAIKRAPK
jgi:PKD repeat protein